MSRRVNPWKVSTIILLIALVLVVGRGSGPSDAEAAGPARLSKALAALKAGKKFLDDAKDPPAPFHAQSLAIVNQAILAVEREIKAHEDKVAKEKAKGDHDKKKDADKKKDGDKKRDEKKKEPHKPTGVDD